MVTLSPLEREVSGSARNRCDFSWKGAVLPGRSDAEMGCANSLYASAQYRENNETFCRIHTQIDHDLYLFTE